MLWLNRFHDDHMAVVRILPRLEGTLKDIEYGEAGPNAVWDLKEFADLIKNVIIPHFKEEEKIVYPRASSVDKAGHDFILTMYDEHNELYEAFDGFIKIIEAAVPGKPSGLGDSPSRIISQSGNYHKHEVPKNLDRVVPVKSLGGSIDKEEILRHGYKIVEMLKEHIEKEETAVAELVKKANKMGK